MSNQETCICDNCREEIPVRSKFCLNCGVRKQRVGPEGKRLELWLQIKLCGSYTEAPKPAPVCSVARITVESGEGGATPVAQSVTPNCLDKDGGLNVRKHRAIEEVGSTEPTVKVSRKGDGAPKGTKQVCVELSNFYQRVKKSRALVKRCYFKYSSAAHVQKRGGLGYSVQVHASLGYHGNPPLFSNH